MPAPADGRFAPSPSGPLHLGNLRTALLAWLFARSAGARFLLRVEDLDRERSRPEHEAAQIADLRAIGLDWDAEAPRQSARGERYRECLEELRERELVYPCWCTRAEVRLAAAAPHANGAEGAYPGTCRGVGKRREPPRAWRLDAQAARRGFEDRLCGHFEREVDDFVVWRGDGTAAYNLAVVVDDGDQGVREVVRGVDLLETTPRQLLLAELLGLPAPRHAHVPLVLGAGGRRLAKRDGAVTLGEQRARGRAIAEIVGWMAASAGLAARGTRASAAELLASFDPSHLTREPARLPAEWLAPTPDASRT